MNVMKKIRAHHIKKGLAERHATDFFLTEVKNGPTQYVARGSLLILDALAIKKSWSRPCFTGYEVKVDRNDFLNDEKWPGYMDYCHRFYFACPKGLIKPEELPDEVGLVWYDPSYDKVGNLYTVRKALFRKIEISPDMLYYIILSRLESDRHPFFSNEREELEMWVEDKIEREKLSYRVRNKIFEQIEQLNKEKSMLEWDLSVKEQDAETLKEVLNIMKEVGIDTSRIGSRWHKDWKEELKAQLKSNLPGAGLKLITQIKNDAQKLYEIINI